MDYYCRYCGKELKDGICDCAEFQEEYNDGVLNEKEPFLIKEFHVDTSSFSGFVTSLRNLSGVDEQSSDATDPYEHNVLIVPDCIEPEDNEIIVKQYNIAKLRTRLKFMKAEGRLQVTNRRILFRAAGTSLTGNILQEHQFDLDQIGGIQIHKDYKFSFLNFFGSFFLNGLAMAILGVLLSGVGYDSIGFMGFLCFILGVAGMVPTFIVYKHFWLKLFCAIIGSSAMSMAYVAMDSNGLVGFLGIVTYLIMLIDLMIVCFVPNLVLKIKTKGATEAVTIGSQKSVFRRKTGDDYSGFAEILPWEDTVMAMNELGTMIDDLQKLGDYAIEKWSK